MGVPLGVLLASAIAALYFLLRRHRLRKKIDPAQNSNTASADALYEIPTNETVNRNIELDATNLHELSNRY